MPVRAHDKHDSGTYHTSMAQLGKWTFKFASIRLWPPGVAAEAAVWPRVPWPVCIDKCRHLYNPAVLQAADASVPTKRGGMEGTKLSSAPGTKWCPNPTLGTPLHGTTCHIKVAEIVLAFCMPIEIGVHFTIRKCSLHLVPGQFFITKNVHCINYLFTLCA